MAYTATTWVNDNPPPIDQVHLQNMETGISNAALRIEDTNVVAVSGATQTIPDVTVATLSQITLTATCTFTFPAAARGKSFVVGLVQGGIGSFGAVWPAIVKWPNGVSPILTTTVGKEDLFGFVCMDGTNYLGSIIGQAY